MTELGEYIRAAASRPAAWGTHDCCTFISDWGLLRTGRDPMAFMRGRYSSFAGAMRFILIDGLPNLVRRGMIEAAFPEPDEPQPGDIGVIACPTEDRVGYACALYSGPRWVSLSMRGIEAAPDDALAVWRPC